MTQAFNLSQLANKVNTSGKLEASTGLTGSAPAAATLVAGSFTIYESGGYLYIKHGSTNIVRFASDGATTVLP
jgi:hypothetical protein